MATAIPARRLEAGTRVFSRIVVGIDGSQQAFEAARQAALLQDVDGQLTLFSAWDFGSIAAGNMGDEIPSHLADELQRNTAQAALVAAREYVAPYAAATLRAVRGAAVAALLDEIGRDGDTLVAVGSSGTGRLFGVMEGGVVTTVLQRAPCAVLLSRPASTDFPRRIVVGIDGSDESAAAYGAARYLAERFGAELQVLVARGGERVNERRIATITGGEHEDRREAPADALLRAASASDLVAVGGRGLGGVRALGSVSELVARTSSCSTLIVRAPRPR